MKKNNKNFQRSSSGNKFRRAQIEMGETIVVIFILMILIIFGLLTVYHFQVGGARQTQQRFGSFKTIELAQVVTNMPELQCSFIEVIDVTCIDEVKAVALASILKNPNNRAFYYYRETLGTAKIEIEEIYPEPNKIVVYDNSRGMPNAEPTFIPVSLYKPAQRRSSFALLKATRYYR